MMNPNEINPEQTGVSITERLMPSLSYGLAAIAGAVGALMIRMFFESMRHAENAGYDAFFSGVARICGVTGTVLALAAMIGVVGTVLSTVRMFGTRAKASPPGVLFLATGALALLPAMLAGRSIWISVGAITGTERAGLAMVGDTVGLLTGAALVLAVLATVVLAVFSFIPFSSGKGRKYLPLICIALVEIGIVTLAGGFLWAAREAMSMTDASVF